MLRRIFGPTMEEDGSWRKLYNDELLGLSTSLNIVRVIKSERMWRAVQLACMGEGTGEETTGKTKEYVRV
jgi:hypothetical protein